MMSAPYIKHLHCFLLQYFALLYLHFRYSASNPKLTAAALFGELQVMYYQQQLPESNRSTIRAIHGTGSCNHRAPSGKSIQRDTT